jgi:hypothetical protein
MLVDAIPREQWGTFAEQFSRQHRGWLVSVEVTDTRLLEVDPEQARAAGRVLARDRALREVAFDLEGGTGQFRVVVGEEPDRVAHEIRRPVSVRPEMSDDGAHQGVRIDDADGKTTRVRFRAPALPELLDGIGEAEW